MMNNRIPRLLIVFSSILVAMLLVTAVAAFSSDNPTMLSTQEEPVSWQPAADLVPVFDIQPTPWLTQGNDSVQRPKNSILPSSDNRLSPNNYAKNVDFLSFIGGWTNMAFQGHLAYVSQGPKLTIFDVTDPVSPRSISESYFLPSLGAGVQVDGDTAYFTERGWLRIIDIADPTNPVEIGHYDIGYDWGIAVKDDYVFALDCIPVPDPDVEECINSLIAIDVSNPADPKQVGSYERDLFDAWLEGVVVEGNYAYVFQSHRGAFHIFDISDPTSMTRVSSFDKNLLYAFDMRIVGDRAYVLDDDAVSIVDISDPTNPTEIGRINDFAGNDVLYGMDVIGNLVFVTSDTGLHIIDVFNPAAPSIIGFFDPSGHAGWVNVQDNIVYLWDYFEGVHILDVSEPTTPAAIGLYKIISGNKSAVAKDIAYLASNASYSKGPGRMTIIDLSKRSDPILISAYDTEMPIDDIVAAGDTVYLATGGEELRIIDVSNPVIPNGVGYLHLEDIEAIITDDIYVYALTGEGFHVIDVSDADSPKEIGYFAKSWTARDFAIIEGYAYVPFESEYGKEGMSILDISDPINPFEIRVYPVDVDPYYQNIAVSDSRAYLLWLGDLLILDASDPANPEEIGVLSLPDYTVSHSFTVDGNTVYAANYYPADLSIIEASKPAEPSELGFFDGLEVAQIAFADGYIYLVHPLGGFYILAPETTMAFSPQQVELKGYLGATLQTTVTLTETVGIVGIEGITLAATDLVANNGAIIPADSITFSPTTFDLPAGASQEVVSSIVLPDTLSPGTYQGSIIVESRMGDSWTIPVTIRAEFGSIVIAKETKNNSTAQFNFTGDLGSFSLVNGESKAFPGIPVESYTVQEQGKIGWHLEEVICSGGEATDIAGGIIVNLDVGEAIQCTFINRQLTVTADAGGPYTGDEGAAIVLDASGTNRQEMVTEYQWDCTNDGPIDQVSDSPTGGSCIYADDGEYTLKLTAVDIFGRTSSDTAAVSIENVAPQVDAGIDQTVITNQAVDFSGSFTDPGTADTHVIEWDFGDGNKAWDTLTPQHAYTSIGRYTVTLTVTDDDGGTGTATMTVEVVNGAPTMKNVKVSPPVVDEGQRFILSGLLAEPEEGRMSLLVNWGDGQTQTIALSPGSTSFSINHCYPDDPPGTTEGETYSINLTLSDAQGAFSTSTATIEVKNVAPTVNAGPDRRTVKGQTLAFQAAINDTGIVDTHTIIWDFGDGSTPVAGAEATHTFADQGTYIVIVTAEDDDGGIGQDSLTVEVKETNDIYLPILMR